MRGSVHQIGGDDTSLRVPLHDVPVCPVAWGKAWRAFLDEDYSTSLALARGCLDGVQPPALGVLSLVPNDAAPRVKDCVLLSARNLFYLEKFDDFELLHAASGRRGLIPENMLEFEVLRLAFAQKRGQCQDVITTATEFIDNHRQELPPVIADYLFLRGQALSAVGEPGAASEDAEAAYALFRLLSRPLEAARTANLLGVIAFRRADYPEAITWFERSQALHAQLRMVKNMGGTRLNIGIAHYKQGAVRRAILDLDAAAKLLSVSGSQLSLCRVGIARGNTLRMLRRFAEARSELAAAYQTANKLMLSREEALALEFLGDVHRDEGQITQARRYYSRALAIGSSIAPTGDVVMEVLRRQGECFALSGRQAEAIPVLTRALGMARQQEDRFEEGVIKRVLAAALLGLGDLDSAERYGDDAAALLRTVGGRHELAIALLLVADIAVARFESGVCADPGGLLDRAWRDTMAALEFLLTMEIDHWVLLARRQLERVATLRSEEVSAAGGRHDGVTTSPLRRLRRGLPIVHVSARMRDLIQLADAFADSGEPVLITGDTGTGKELFARRLHRKGSRCEHDLVCVNVAAIASSLFEREFFGHTRGAYSGADSDGIGLAARANGGTLFLDEIGELPLALQPRLLRLLQDGSYQALGDPAERHTDLRLIAATNADLCELVALGKFRADLYYRLKILELRLPPLVERREDILPLLRHLLAQAAGREVVLGEYFNAASLDLAQRYRWPGNVREIGMVARQAQIQLASCGVVCVELGNHTDESLQMVGPESASTPAVGRVVGRISDRSTGRSRLLLALSEAAGNRAEAARTLGVSRSTLYRQMDKFGIAGKRPVVAGTHAD